MIERLADLLSRGADLATVPDLDLAGVLAEAGRRQRRRRLALVATSVVAVGAIAAGSVLVARTDGRTQHPEPVAPPSATRAADSALDPEGRRPLVYAEGSTVHVGDRTIRARDPVAFIEATDDGAVYEAAYDGTLWFTDGVTTSIIGTSASTAAPTTRVGVVTTGDVGSLVAWADRSAGPGTAPREFVVYDTSQRQEVARIPFTHPGAGDMVLLVGADRVLVNPDPETPGCWVIEYHRPCPHPDVLRFDVPSGRSRRVPMEPELAGRARGFATTPHHGDLALRQELVQVGQRLVAMDSAGRSRVLRMTSGDVVDLRLPSGFTALGHRAGASVISVSQWLDDDHVVVWANGGGGDLPAQQGDLLVCPIPRGTCHVTVPRSSQTYVAPW